MRGAVEPFSRSWLSRDGSPAVWRQPSSLLEKVDGGRAPEYRGRWAAWRLCVPNPVATVSQS